MKLKILKVSNAALRFDRIESVTADLCGDEVRIQLIGAQTVHKIKCETTAATKECYATIMTAWEQFINAQE